jgi:hypothetical protein
MYRDIAAPLT